MKLFENLLYVYRYSHYNNIVVIEKVRKKKSLKTSKSEKYFLPFCIPTLIQTKIEKKLFFSVHVY